MRKACVYFLKILLGAGLFIGCGSDGEEKPPAPDPAVLVKVIPRDGEKIVVNGVIVLEFDKRPENVNTIPPRTVYYANEVEAKTGRRHFQNFSLGSIPIVAFSETVLIFPLPIPVPITVFWGQTDPQESMTLTYTVIPIDFDFDRLMITGGYVSDGSTDVDPEIINSEGKLLLEFSREVTGHITLETETGENVGWLGSVDGSRACLELVTGRELKHETTYVIVGKVSDAAGTELIIRETFITKIKA